jgi:hypothetical protein
VEREEIMLVKIGTLGTMKADFASLKTQNNQLIAVMEVEEGVKWEIVAAVGYKEIWKIAKAMIKPSVMWYIVSGWARGKDVKPPKL